MASFEFTAVILSILGLSVSITYYANVLLNANKTRRAQLMMQAYNRLDTQERRRAFLNFAQWEFNTFEEWLEKYGPEKNPEATEDFINLLLYFEGLGALAHSGFLDIELVARLIGGGFLRFWSRFEPIKEQLSEYFHYPRLWAETHYLYEKILEYKKAHPEYDA
jgi:hypothetical protein